MLCWLDSETKVNDSGVELQALSESDTVRGKLWVTLFSVSAWLTYLWIMLKVYVWSASALLGLSFSALLVIAGVVVTFVAMLSLNELLLCVSSYVSGNRESRSYFLSLQD